MSGGIGGESAAWGTDRMRSRLVPEKKKLTIASQVATLLPTPPLPYPTLAAIDELGPTHHISCGVLHVEPLLFGSHDAPSRSARPELTGDLLFGAMQAKRDLLEPTFCM